MLLYDIIRVLNGCQNKFFYIVMTVKLRFFLLIYIITACVLTCSLESSMGMRVLILTI